jgi:hypothetical protein
LFAAIVFVLSVGSLPFYCIPSSQITPCYPYYSTPRAVCQTEKVNNYPLFLCIKCIKPGIKTNLNLCKTENRIILENIFEKIIDFFGESLYNYAKAIRAKISLALKNGGYQKNG